MSTDNSGNVCEEKVYEDLFRTLSQSIFHYIFYKYGNEEKAHDVVQEAFVKLWEHCAKVPPEKARSYVYTVANNLYLNVIKAEKVRMRYAAGARNTTNVQTPEYLMMEAQYRQKLEDALNRLPENQRTTFLLNRIDGMKYQEIADMEGVSVKAIEKRMTLALKSLRDEVEGI